MDKVLLNPKLNPKAKLYAIKLQDYLKNVLGITILYTYSYRSNDEQANLYASGRTRAGRIVTNARPGYSYHNYGLALDFVPIVDGKAAWNRIDLFDKIGKVAKAYGFEWGGNFKSPVDKPHIQMTFKLTISDLLSGKRPK